MENHSHLIKSIKQITINQLNFIHVRSQPHLCTVTSTFLSNNNIAYVQISNSTIKIVESASSIQIFNNTNNKNR
jgi:hypothetical protein